MNVGRNPPQNLAIVKRDSKVISTPPNLEVSLREIKQF